jgi:hypothetical protein
VEIAQTKHGLDVIRREFQAGQKGVAGFVQKTRIQKNLS